MKFALLNFRPVIIFFSVENQVDVNIFQLLNHRLAFQHSASFTFAEKDSLKNLHQELDRFVIGEIFKAVQFQNVTRHHFQGHGINNLEKSQISRIQDVSIHVRIVRQIHDFLPIWSRIIIALEQINLRGANL